MIDSYLIRVDCKTLVKEPSLKFESFDPQEYQESIQEYLRLIDDLLLGWIRVKQIIK